MFNNLIESTSHRREFTRRGSFLLFTTITYAVMLTVSGVVSIYAYDAHLEDQNYEQVLTMLPLEPVVKATTPTHPEKPRTADNNKSNIPERAIAMANVNVPQAVPPNISTTPNKVPPLPDGPVRITGRNWDPPVAFTGTGPSTPGSIGITKPPTIVLDEELPPQPPQPPAKKTILSKGVITGEAIYLPKPIYSSVAKAMHLQGQVVVQVLIDEGGKVISAQVVSGHPVLAPETKKAALQARFKPTMLSGQPVKVSGLITYNFVPQ